MVLSETQKKMCLLRHGRTAVPSGEGGDERKGKSPQRVLRSSSVAKEGTEKNELGRRAGWNGEDPGAEVREMKKPPPHDALMRGSAQRSPGVPFLLKAAAKKFGKKASWPCTSETLLRRWSRYASWRELYDRRHVSYSPLRGLPTLSGLERTGGFTFAKRITPDKQRGHPKEGKDRKSDGNRRFKKFTRRGKGPDRGHDRPGSKAEEACRKDGGVARGDKTMQHRGRALVLVYLASQNRHPRYCS